jgi:hypothetical protein
MGHRGRPERGFDPAADLAEIDPEVPEQGVGLALRRVAATDDRDDLASDLVRAAPTAGEQLCGTTGLDGQAGEEVLGAHVVVVQRLGLAQGEIEHQAGVVIEVIEHRRL